MKKVKITVISNLYPSEKYPSFGVFVQNFCVELEQDDFEVNLVTIRGKSGEGFGKLFHYMKLFLRIIGALLFNSGDLIYVHYGSHPLVPLAWLLPLIKKPVVINFHGEDLVGDSGWEKKIRPMLRNVIEGSHLIVLPSEYFASIFSQRYQNPNVFISPSGGIDISKFRPLSSFNSNSVKRFGFVARIERGKGWLTMLRAIERLSKSELKALELHIVGAGADEDYLKLEVERLGMNDFIKLHGEMGHDRLPFIMQQLDFLVLPSELNESLGLVGVEAMACGVPVIASDIPAFRTYVENTKNGWLFEKGNDRQLAELFSRILSMETSSYEVMRKNCIETACQFDSKEVAKRLNLQLKKLVE
jgi:glycosyltransferase involved in cell wall biosynthesis